MQIRKILTAAAAAITLGLAAAPAAQADVWGHAGHRGVERRVVVDHRVVFSTLRAHRIRYVGTPYFLRGHYVVRSFDRLGHSSFVEVNPYTGAFIGFIRL
ncbi:MAG: hypothetical protein WDM86_07655 [Rhizomicrobium sp.]